MSRHHLAGPALRPAPEPQIPVGAMVNRVGSAELDELQELFTRKAEAEMEASRANIAWEVALQKQRRACGQKMSMRLNLETGEWVAPQQG